MVSNRSKIIIVICFVAWIAFSATAFWTESEYESRPFNSAEWKTWSEKEMKRPAGRKEPGFWTRRSMLDDLIASCDLTGYTREQLVELLGEPIAETHRSDWDVYYPAGLCDDKIFAVDFIGLFIRFDEEGKVEAYRELLY